MNEPDARRQARRELKLPPRGSVGAEVKPALEKRI
jgi:hypothetical protein